LELGEIVNEKYYKNSKWKVLEVSEEPPVDVSLPWDKLEELQQYANIKNYLRQTKTKQMYFCPLVYDGIGIGKFLI
jgi:hypothetical protein